MVGLIHEFTYYCVLESGLKQPEHLQFLVAITAEQIKRTYTIRVGELNESGLVVKAGNAIGDCLAAEGNFSADISGCPTPCTTGSRVSMGVSR